MEPRPNPESTELPTEEGTATANIQIADSNQEEPALQTPSAAAAPTHLESSDTQADMESPTQQMPIHFDHDFIPELQPNEINFPQLTPTKTTEPETPAKKVETPSQRDEVQPQADKTHTSETETTPLFVWRRKDTLEEQPSTKGKEKMKGPDSARITRQGYRSGRLADDFWTALNVPDTPQEARKRLRVYPFLVKNHNHTEYLVDTQNHKAISTVHISEQLAGIPWTTQRARQHIVNEVTQALHKLLIFNNQQTTPFHKWHQGRWYSQWTPLETGEQICTLYVNIDVQESKIKIRKGKKLGWKELPAFSQVIWHLPHTEEILPTAEHGTEWKEMAGYAEASPTSPQVPATMSHNPFSVLSEEPTQITPTLV